VDALRADWYANATDEERRANEQVVDLDAAEITCPACGETFASGPSECPECGLGLV
jgi:rubrerythrin